MTICLALIRIPDVESWTKMTSSVVISLWQYETDQSWSKSDGTPTVKQWQQHQTLILHILHFIHRILRTHGVY